MFTYWHNVSAKKIVVALVLTSNSVTNCGVVTNYQGGDLSNSECELELLGCLAIRVIWERAVKIKFEKFSSQKIQFPGISPKSPQKEAFI